MKKTGEKFFKKMITASTVLMLAGCNLAPEYHRPTLPPTPQKFKEAGHWLHAKPKSADLERGPWWKMYGDPELNALEAQVILANQDLKAALARYDVARAGVTIARAGFFPNVIGIVNTSRIQSSGNVANKLPIPLYSDKGVSVDFNYEVDVWGKIRNMVAAAKNTAYASAADLAFVNLSLHVELAMDYFSLRAADASQKILDDTVIAYQKALFLTKQRYTGGAAPEQDYDQAVSQLETAKTQAADNHLKRAQLEHAIAVLIGRAPANFSATSQLPKTKIVTIPPLLPSQLLERRPDVAEAEFNVQVANANIGIARAAFFPDFNISGSFGVESALLANLFRGPSIIWSLGPSAASTITSSGTNPLATQTIFDGGRLIGLSQQACANYFETVANYRQTVLNAYKDVEDNLIAIKQLDKERITQAKATSSEEKALAQALYRYQGGLTTYLDVVVIQNLALQSQLNLVNVNVRRQIASVLLIKALGGGWDVKDIAQC